MKKLLEWFLECWKGFFGSVGDGDRYRLGVGMMLVNSKNQIFVGQRFGRPEWQMPQGGIDYQEQGSPEGFTQAAWREMEEEIGTRKARLVSQSQGFYAYKFPKGCFTLWRLRFKGQKHKWFLFSFQGIDQDINLKASLFPEFEAWKWTPPEKLLQECPFSKKEVYRSVLKEFDAFLKAEHDQKELARKRHAQESHV